MENPARTQIFISYSHKDKKWLERVQTHLKPLARDGLVTPWDDTKIQPGTKWRDEIAAALASAKAAILLVSADFLASDFIHQDELPPLLVAAEKLGARIIPIIVSPCRFSKTPGLSQFQAITSQPLTDMGVDAQESVFNQVAGAIEAAVTNPQ